MSKFVEVKETKVIPMMVEGVKKELSSDVVINLESLESRDDLLAVVNGASDEALSLILSGVNSLAKAKAVYKVAKYDIMDEAPEEVPEQVTVVWSFEPVQGGRFSYRKEAEKCREQAQDLVTRMFAGELTQDEAKEKHQELIDKANEYDRKADEQAKNRKPRTKTK